MVHHCSASLTEAREENLGEERTNLSNSNQNPRTKKSKEIQERKEKKSRVSSLLQFVTGGCLTVAVRCGVCLRAGFQGSLARLCSWVRLAPPCLCGRRPKWGRFVQAVFFTIHSLIAKRLSRALERFVQMILECTIFILRQEKGA